MLLTEKELCIIIALQVTELCIDGGIAVCLYKSGNGKIYSDEELNGAYLVAKRKYPNLSVKQYRQKLSGELDGLNRLPFSTVSELCINGMPEEAVMLYARNNNCSMEQAKLAVSLLHADGRC